MTCVLSVEVFPDGNYGNIRIVTGNAPYIGSIESPMTYTGDSGWEPKKFIPDSPYTDYVPHDLNFECAVYSCAVEQKPIHAYIRPERFDFWMEMFLLPLQPPNGNIHYCTYSQVISKDPDYNRLADLSYETAADVLMTCIKLRGAKDFQKTMDEVIGDIRRICCAARCAILLMDFNHRVCSVLCEDLDPDKGLRPMRQIVDADFFEIAESWSDAIDGSNCLVITDKHDWAFVKERTPAWYDNLRVSGVETLVLYPLLNGEELLGYIWTTNFDVEHIFRIKETLKLTTVFLAAEIANFQFVKRMETLGSIDLLTGIYNRNAMNNRLLQLAPRAERTPSAFGVVCADLNGLRQMNSRDGHYAGDLQLKNAALVLQKIFLGNEIYRIGGDEFLILAVDISEEELNRRVEKLRQQSSAECGVNFAVGCAYDSEGKDIRRTMRLADERMYEDKALYYRLHPEKMQ